MLSTALGLGLVALTGAQFPPEREGVKVLKSKFHDGVTISYKEPGLCETTPGVRSYSGYVHLPPASLTEPGEAQAYPINTFFWFFEARHDPHNAPLSIWLNGGPGGSSATGLLAENGPCFVNADSNSTYLNPWSWNNHANMLYIDQPNQVGFSYGVPTNITVNLAADPLEGPPWKVADFSAGVPAQNATFLVGTAGSQNLSFTANSTNHSAVALWHFAQTWFEEFPAYKPHDERVSLWTESYGGKYGPAIVSHWERQNELIDNGTISAPGAHRIRLDTLGIINGCVDTLLQDREYVEFAHNNTYGIKAFDDDEYAAAIEKMTGPGGVEDMVRDCRRLAAELDPRNVGDVPAVNALCGNASRASFEVGIVPYYLKRAFGWFDVTHPLADPQPPAYFQGWLNQHWVQRALGVPVNFTASSFTVAAAFTAEGDMARGGPLDELAYVLDRGIKVALVYGDRDYACSWRGGERVSLAIPWSRRADFAGAGYAPILTNPFYSGGRTRQLGNLSFSRVYQAGHMVPYYQPETAYHLFMRSTVDNLDVATGREGLAEDLKTEGPDSVWHIRNDVLPPPEPECYTLDVGQNSCTEEQQGWLRDGTAIVKDFILVGRDDKSREVDEDQRADYAWSGDSEQIPLNVEL